MLDEEGADTSKAFTVVGGFGGYFKSVKGVSEYSTVKIVLQVAKTRITVLGDNLIIAKYFQQDLLITGDIRGVQIE